MALGKLIEPDLDFVKELKRSGGESLKKCFQCSTCTVVCNHSPEDRPFPRKEMILAQWGRSQELAIDPDIWLCYQCNDCTVSCPRGARPADVLAAIRAHVYKRFAFPPFMGRALASPGALPVLLVIPMLVLLGSMLLFAPVASDGAYLLTRSAVVDFNLFLPHGFVDALFVFGNVMIFAFAGIGFVRFWKGLKQTAGRSEVLFIAAAVTTLKEIIGHKRFFDCKTNRPRAWGHILVSGGFVGAMFTTGAVFLTIFVPHYLEKLGLEALSPFFTLPLNLPNPIKFVGMFSGLSLMAGGGLLIFRRWTNRDQVGANGYVDYLFLYIISLAGFTGMLSWLTRLAGSGTVAYPTYLAHLTLVFFLLWYMPYSKFAHMIYRSLALVHARQIGRRARQ